MPYKCPTMRAIASHMNGIRQRESGYSAEYERTRRKRPEGYQAARYKRSLELNPDTNRKAVTRKQTDIDARARYMVYRARGRERDKGVPVEERLPLETWQYIADQIREGDYVLRQGKPEHPMAPSLSRVDHSDPHYTDNFIVEPWFLNVARLNFDHDEFADAVRTVDTYPGGLVGQLTGD